MFDVELRIIGETAWHGVDRLPDRHRHDHGVEVGSKLARALEPRQHLHERGGCARKPDPSDRRGVLLELTDSGRQRQDDYIELAGRRERELLSALDEDEKQQLNQLLRKLLAALQAELGPAPKRRSSAAELAESS